MTKETSLNNEDQKYDFENAISSTGFGKFNYLIFLVVVPVCMANMFEANTMSYVFTVACDLHLSLNDKGLLNAITFMGMIFGGPVWGYLFDTLGRKKLLAAGLLLDGILVVFSALSQSKQMLMVLKFLGGFIINGCSAALTSYCSEFFCRKYRARMQMYLGVLNSLGHVTLPFLAWIIFPKEIEFKVLGLNFHSWNVYLLVCSIPALLGGSCFLLMPESPKYLMAMGRNREALEVFRTIFKYNSGKNKKLYPVKILTDDCKVQITVNRSKVQALREGWRQILPLFRKPHLTRMLHIALMFFGTMMGINMLRQWLPQLFQAISVYQSTHNGSSSDLCVMIEKLRFSGINKTHGCVVNTSGSAYFNSMIVGIVGMICKSIAGLCINFVGKKRILLLYGLVSGVCCMVIYLSQDIVAVIALSSTFSGLGSSCTSVMLAVLVEIFPTMLKTTTLSFCLTASKMGSMSGNLLFPLLLQTGCEVPFFFIGSLIIVTAMSSVFLPNTEVD